MATHALSTVTSTAHPRFLRGGNAPGRLLSEAEVLALVGNDPEAGPGGITGRESIGAPRRGA